MKSQDPRNPFAPFAAAFLPAQAWASGEPDLGPWDPGTSPSRWMSPHSRASKAGVRSGDGPGPFQL